MRLYHHPLSANARRALMTAIHLGIKLDLIVVDLGKGAQRAPEFLRLNPNGKVPVLDDDGFILTESHAIMQYLADGAPGQTVYPEDRRARADVNRWLFWSASHFQPAVSVLGWERMVKPMLGLGAPDPNEVQRGERLIGQLAPVLDAQLGGKQWVLGNKLTLADFALAAPLAIMERAQLPLAQYANLQSWLQRVQGLEAWKQTGT